MTKKDINNNGYDYVDLGLPSKSLWAACNVGASKPSESGLYFQWGDTRGYAAEQIEKEKIEFSWFDYKFTPNKTKITKYKEKGGKLQLEDDAVRVNMGGDWHMPTNEQIQELIDNTASKWTKLNGVKGRLFISKTDDTKSIFIPAVGYAYYGAIQLRGIFGAIWGAMVNSKDNECAQGLGIEYDSSSLSRNSRCLGFPARGVLG